MSNKKNVPALPGRKTIVSGDTAAGKYAYAEVVEKGRDLAEVAREDFATNDPGKVWLAIERRRVVLGEEGYETIDPATLPGRIVALREATLLSWGSISARSSVTEGALRKLYREVAERSEKVGVSNSVAVRRARVAGEVAGEADAA